ncbi:helix-turn-helix transcriptional regulator [Paenibacillus sp. B01]|uniref:helix-turn-helix transcriptional regulator n=1 Tax=Paenibacillus sp. B01 TaxID=2660554 RepID=UPI00129BDF16|nr:AraC family transcriptional regulator [Paenibacillus sp. B01]QGG54869.1 helix-turn-helix domain-containing protein [Paenibacillus sp. B01]
MISINLDFAPQVALAGFISYGSPWMHFRRVSDEPILYLVKSGELHLLEDGQPHVLRSGDALLLEAGLEHEGTAAHACDYYYIHFRHPELIRLPSGGTEPLVSSFFREEEEEADSRCRFPKQFHIPALFSRSPAAGVLSELIQLQRRKQYNRVLASLKLAELFVWLSREHMLAQLQRSRKRTSRLDLAAHELLDRIHQDDAGKWTGERIERELGCSFDALNRSFRQLAGMPIAQYANKVRIDRACELLRTTTLRVGEIGRLVGFEDVYSFSKAFKKSKGVPPSAYGAGGTEV